MPAKSEKQRRFMGAELARKRAGNKTRTDMSEDKLEDFASKEFVMKDALEFIDNYIKKDDTYISGLGEVPVNETKPIRRVRRVHQTEPSDEVIRQRIKEGGRDAHGMGSRLTGKELRHRKRKNPTHQEMTREGWRQGTRGEWGSDQSLPAYLEDKKDKPWIRREWHKRSPYATVEEGPTWSPYTEEDTVDTSQQERRESMDATPTPQQQSQQRVAANRATSQQRVKANAAASQERVKANTAASNEYTSKQKLDWRGAWVEEETPKKKTNFNRIGITESTAVIDNAKKRKQKADAEAVQIAAYSKFAKTKSGVPEMNYKNIMSQISKQINHLEKRRMYTPEESREAFDRMDEKEQRQRDFDHDNELRQKKGQPKKSPTHVDRSVKFRDLEKAGEYAPEPKGSFDDRVTQAIKTSELKEEDFIDEDEGSFDEEAWAEYQAWINSPGYKTDSKFREEVASRLAENEARQAEFDEDTARSAAYAKRNKLGNWFETEEEYQRALSNVTDRDKELMATGYPSNTRYIDQPDKDWTTKKDEESMFASQLDKHIDSLEKASIPLPDVVVQEGAIGGAEAAKGATTRAATGAAEKVGAGKRSMDAAIHRGQQSAKRGIGRAVTGLLRGKKGLAERNAAEKSEKERRQKFEDVLMGQRKKHGWTKSNDKPLSSKDLLPTQDANGNFVPNNTIPFTPETNELMSLAADAISTYIKKDSLDDNYIPPRAARRNKKEASKRKMKVSGAGVKGSQRMIGRRAAQARGESV